MNAILETRYIFDVSQHISGKIEIGGYHSFAKIPGNINGRVIRILKDMLNKNLFEEIREKHAWNYSIRTHSNNY